jgi:hypothetical protein
MEPMFASEPILSAIGMGDRSSVNAQDSAKGEADIRPMIKVQVLTIGGTEIGLEVPFDSTLSSFKDMVQEQGSVPKMAQLLFFEGRQLPKDDSGEATLESFSIGAGAQLTVVPYDTLFRM